MLGKLSRDQVMASEDVIRAARLVATPIGRARPIYARPGSSTVQVYLSAIRARLAADTGKEGREFDFPC
jgi:hypothetical protein